VHTALLEAHQSLSVDHETALNARHHAEQEQHQSHTRLAETTGKLKELTRVLDMRTSALESAKASIVTLEGMLNDERQAMSTLKEKISQSQKNQAEQTRENTTQNARLQDLTSHVERLSGDIARINHALAEKEAELNTVRYQLKTSEQKVITLKESLNLRDIENNQLQENLREDVKALKTVLDTTRMERNSVQEELFAMRSAQERERAMHEAATREFSKRLSNAFPDDSDFNMSQTTPDEQSRDMKQKITELKTEIAGLEASLKKTRADREFLRSELMDVRQEAERAKVAVETDNAELRQRIEDLAEVILNLVEDDPNVFDVITLPAYAEASNG
jgi:chromosome segregation ATPase